MADVNMPGVYAIRNTENGKIYVGSTSRKISVRWYEHRKSLKKGNHHSIFLQRAWDKGGKEAFEFLVIENVSDFEFLLPREQFWLDFYQSSNKRKGYNISPTAGNCLGRVVSEETRLKMSKSATGRKASEETKALMSQSQKNRVRDEEDISRKISEALTGKKRGPLSDEHKAKISVAGKGLKRSPETCKKLSIVASNRKPSEETRLRMSEARRKRPPQSLETTKKKSETFKRLWQDPEYRNKIIEARALAKARRIESSAAKLP